MEINLNETKMLIIEGYAHIALLSLLLELYSAIGHEAGELLLLCVNLLSWLSIGHLVYIWVCGNNPYHMEHAWSSTNDF